MRLLTYLNYTHSLICNFLFKDAFNILTFHAYISGVYFWVFEIILVEINVEGVSLEMCEKVSAYGQNHKAEQLPNNERYWTLLTKEYLSCVI